MCGGTRHEGPIIPLRLHHSPHIVNIPGYTFHQHLFHGTNLLISTYNVISVRKAKIFLFVSLFFLTSLLSLANRLLMKWVGAVSGGWMKERKRKQTRFEGKTRKLIFFCLYQFGVARMLLRNLPTSLVVFFPWKIRKLREMKIAGFCFEAMCGEIKRRGERMRREKFRIIKQTSKEEHFHLEERRSC